MKPRGGFRGGGSRLKGADGRRGRRRPGRIQTQPAGTHGRRAAGASIISARHSVLFLQTLVASFLYLGVAAGDLEC